jgi:hypothetical protein
MKKLKLLLASFVMLLGVQDALAQAGTGWTLIPWANPSGTPANGRRATHMQLQSDVNADDNNPWFNVDGIVYGFGYTSPPRGTYELRSTGEFTEIFRQYGPAQASVERTEIRIQEDYNSGDARQFEAYVKLNEKLGDQAFFQIWGYKTQGATLIQLRIDGSGNIRGVGGANPQELFSGIDYRNREFKLHIIHKQETWNSGGITQNGRCQVYIDGRLLFEFVDDIITDYRPGLIDKGGDYFKYGIYGTISSAYNGTAPGVVNAQAIFKGARYFKDGNFPGSTAQQITFTPAASIPLTGGNVTLNGVSTRSSDGASTGLAVGYRSDNPAVAKIVNGNQIQPVSAGTAKIWAYQDGNGTYKPALVQVRTIEIVPGGPVPQAQTITFPVIPAKLTTDAPFALNATSDSGLAVSYASNNTAVATISGNTVTIVGAGSANITASQAGNANYLPATPVTRTLTVTAPPTQQPQTITFPPIGQKLVTDPNFNPGATASSGLAVTYTSSNPAIATIVGGLVDIVGAGTVTITAKQAGNASYFPATDVAQTFTVKTPVTYHKIKLRAVQTLVLNHTSTPANGGVVNVATDTGANNQLWKVLPTTNGYARGLCFRCAEAAEP